MADPYGQWIGQSMSDYEVDTLLNAADWGVLALADGGEPYSIPISFGYTGTEVYFAFVRGDPTGRKFEFISDGSEARLLVTDVNSQFDWQSVAVTGPVRAVDPADEEWETLEEALGGNDWFTAASERARDPDELQGWRLDPDEIGGHEVQPVH
jgi:hypothetical protein